MLVRNRAETVMSVALTGGVDEVPEDSQRTHTVPLITVLQFLQNKHQQPVREGVGWNKEKEKGNIRQNHLACLGKGFTLLSFLLLIDTTDRHQLSKVK